jgi:hypothetical protein
LPDGFGHFFSTPGSDPVGNTFSGARSPVCQNAAMELLSASRYPFPFIFPPVIKNRQKIRNDEIARV